MRRVEVFDGKKECSRCKTCRDISCFGASNKTISGLRSECYDCRNIWAGMNRAQLRSSKKIWYSKNKERLNAERRTPDYRKLQREYKQTNYERYKHKRSSYRTKESLRAERERNRDKINVRKILNYHVNKGNIFKPINCSECNDNGKINAHHEDYKKPLDVLWLCTKCHYKRHRK